MKRALVCVILLFVVADPSVAQSPLSIRVSAGPVVVFRGYESMGFAGDASLQYNIVGSFDVTFTSGYYSFANAQVVPVLAGIKMHLSKTKVQPYIVMELGEYWSWSRVEPPVSSPEPFAFGGSTETTESRQTFGGALGFGFKIPVQDSFSFDLNATAHYADKLTDNLALKMGMSFGL